jgi:hypothetical protein
MPSIEDLPNEVLTRIKVERPELLSLSWSITHFYEVYIGGLYENFTHGPKEEGIQEVVVDYEKGPDDLPDAIKLIQYLNTIFNSPQLARLVKRLEVTGTWQTQLLEWTGGKSIQDTLWTSSKAALSTSQSSFASLLLARLPRVENLNIRLCYLEDNLFYTMGTHKFQSIKISNHYEVPLQTVVGLLGLPYLKSLWFTYQYNTDMGPLNDVPARSSSIEDLQIRQGVILQELGTCSAMEIARP